MLSKSYILVVFTTVLSMLFGVLFVVLFVCCSCVARVLFAKHHAKQRLWLPRAPRDPTASQLPPGATKTSQSQPGAARNSLDQPGEARSSQEQPGASRSSHDQPGAARSSQEQPGALVLSTAALGNPFHLVTRPCTESLHCTLTSISLRAHSLISGIDVLPYWNMLTRSGLR